MRRDGEEKQFGSASKDQTASFFCLGVYNSCGHFAHLCHTNLLLPFIKEM